MYLGIGRQLRVPEAEHGSFEFPSTRQHIARHSKCPHSDKKEMWGLFQVAIRISHGTRESLKVRGNQMGSLEVLAGS